MATIQEATQNAMAFARESLGVERTNGLQLEEIESATEGGTEVWRVTLSMIDANAVNPTESAATATQLWGLLAATSARREYKTFAVAKASGEVKSMKIREMSKA